MTGGAAWPGRSGLFELRRTRNHSVILLVSVVDRRIVPALRLVSRLACTDSRALHIAVDSVETRRLVSDWMSLGLSWLPLEVKDATARSVPASVRNAVRRETVPGGTVTVVVPELNLPGGWHRVLHPGRARRIAQDLQPLSKVTVVIVPFNLAAHDECGDA